MQHKILLILICVFFLVTRFYRIDKIPFSVYWDEASIGYNAYSIARTGKDEWGDFLPLHLRAFGEFKLPIYIYATTFFVKLFGLNEMSVRIPAVLFGLGTTIITYLLTKKLFGSYTGLFATFFLTISPWFFIFSRTGYEATAGVMFYFLAIYLFLFVSRNIWFLPVSVSSFVLSVYSYNSFRIITPLTIFILITFLFGDFKFITKKAMTPFILSVVLLIVSAIPIYRLYTLDAGMARFRTVEISDTADVIKNYLSHFSPNFLLQGDKNLRSQQAGFGQIYYMDILLIPLGLLYIICSKSKYRLLPLILALIAPVPAALTKESPHALRSLSVVPAISMIAALGVNYLKRFLPQKYVLELIILVISSLFFAIYFFNFLYVYPIQSVKDWQYDYKRIYMYDNKRLMDSKKVIISDKYAQPYIFALFYLKYDPDKYRATVVRNPVDQWSFSQVAKFDKFIFRKTDKLIEYE